MKTAQTLALLLLAACGSSEVGPGPAEPQPTTQPTTQQAPAAAPLGEEAKQAVTETIAAYDAVRADLVEDRLDEAKVQALADKAKAGQAQAPDDLKAPLGDLEKAATTLKGQTGDLEAARSTFQDASKAVIAMVAARPDLASSLHVYECPMVEGFQKWVQTEEGTQNPYMGQSMPKCGTRSEWGS